MQKKESILAKIRSAEQLIRECAGWRLSNRKIVFTNGCFDILHAGHVHLLLEAATLGNRLIVGLNSDASVKRLKGSERPINRAEDRALLLAAQTFVDAVVIFEEDTPLQLLEKIQPDVLVKGGDYTKDQVVGHELMEALGGETVIVPFLGGYSTTRTLERRNSGQ